MRTFRDVVTQQATEANPRKVERTIEVVEFMPSENAGYDEQMLPNLRQAEVDKVFGVGCAQLTRIAGTGDCFWWCLERAVVPNPEEGELSGSTRAYGSFEPSTKLTLWKNWIKAYWVAMHGPEMSTEQALSELDKHNFLNDARDVFESDVSNLEGGLETQLKLYRAALVVINKGKDLSHSQRLPALRNNIKWFSPNAGGYDLFCDTDWAAYVANLLGVPIWIIQSSGVTVFTPKTDAIVTLVRNATADISKPFCKNAEKLYPNGEPIVLLINGAHFDLVTHYLNRPNFQTILNKLHFYYQDGNQTVYKF